MNRPSSIRLLHQLARLYGMQTAYYDVAHRRQQASMETLMVMLRSLGAPVNSLQDIAPAWRERRQAQWQRPMEPVIAVWDGRLAPIEVRLPSDTAGDVFSFSLEMETGEKFRWELSGSDLAVVATAEVEGRHYVVKQFSLPAVLPTGYHRIIMELKGKKEEGLIVSAPLKAYAPPLKKDSHTWGVFLPLYALYTDKSWGSGDYSTLEALLDWTSETGGGVVATLPLLTGFWEGFTDPSPYLPMSRLFWNETYLDVEKVPELPGCPAARALMASSSFRDEIRALRTSRLVDYHRLMALKRRALEELCRSFFIESTHRLEEFREYVKTNPAVEDYARFRAAVEKHGISWKSWPQPLRDGNIKDSDYAGELKRYYMYIQWLTHQQMESVAAKARAGGAQLYLDLPVGVRAESYDVWREHDAFVAEAAAGAPPDAVFTRGQNWEFPPLSPEKIREQGYRYVIDCLRHHFRYAGILRIDHVMGLHRLFCIPNGMEARHGVYLHYHADEFYAILNLESSRHNTPVVGEDLGTVPPYVRPAMKEHGLQRMYVLHYELASNPRNGLNPVPERGVASLNTHDMPPFASFWQGQDIAQREKLGLLDKGAAKAERITRRDMIRALRTFVRKKGWLTGPGSGASSALKACLSFLAGSRANVLLVNLEDLWLETQPQNIPSTREEYPNWRRKARYGLEEFSRMPQLVATLRAIDRLRRGNTR